MIAGCAARQQDRAVAGERPERRSALGPPGEAGLVGLEVEQHVAQAERIDRPIEPDGEARPLEPPVEGEPERAVIGVPAGAFEEEGAVDAPEAVAGERRASGAVDPQVGEMDDPVRARG